MTNQEPIQLTAILNKLLACNQKHIHQSEMGRHVDCLYVVLTYCFQLARNCPLLCLFSPAKGCGKTTNLDWLAQYSRNPFISGNMSSSSLFRIIDQGLCSIFFDEFDSMPEESQKAVMNIINNGFHQGRGATRVGEPKDGKRGIETYDTYGPKVFCSLDSSVFSDATLSRTIVKQLEMMPRGERLPRVSMIEPEEIKRDLEKWADENAEEIEEKMKKGDLPKIMLQALSGRQIDVWEPICQIVSFANNEWQDRVLNAALHYSEFNNQNTPSKNVMILEIIRDCFSENDTDKLSSSEIVEYVNRKDEWKNGAWEKFNFRKLAKLARDFGLAGPASFRCGTNTEKGYLRDNFMPAFDKYLLPPER